MGVEGFEVDMWVDGGKKRGFDWEKRDLSKGMTILWLLGMGYDFLLPLNINGRTKTDCL